MPSFYNFQVSFDEVTTAISVFKRLAFQQSSAKRVYICPNEDDNSQAHNITAMCSSAMGATRYALCLQSVSMNLTWPKVGCLVWFLFIFCRSFFRQKSGKKPVLVMVNLFSVGQNLQSLFIGEDLNFHFLKLWAA